MLQPLYIRKIPKLLKLIILIIALSTFFKIGMATADSNGYSVSGGVTFNGNPAPQLGSGGGVTVSFQAADGAYGTANTDTNGNYYVGELQNNSYAGSIYYNNSNESSGTTGVPNYLNMSTNTPSVVVNGGNVTQNYYFAANTITVTVKDGSGNLVSGSYVWASDVGNNTITTTDNSATFSLSPGQEGSNGNTDSDGTIALGVLPGVTYSVCALTSSGTEYCAPVNVTVNGNTATEINFPALYSVSGSITFNGNPASQLGSGGGVIVSFQSADGAYGTTSTDLNGNYSVGGLQNDSYTATISYSNDNELSGTTGVPNSLAMSTTTPSVIVNSGNVTQQNYSFSTNTVTVTVKDGNGNPVSGSYVWASDVGNNTITTTDNSSTFNLSQGEEGSNGYTGSSGTIGLGVLSGVTYSVCALTASGTEYCTPVNVTVNGNVTAEIDFPALYSVSGSATFDGNAAPLANGQGLAVSFLASDGAYGTTYTDSNGNYSVGELQNDSYSGLVYYNNSNEPSGTTGVPNYMNMSTTTHLVVVNGGNATQNYYFATNTITVTVKDGNGNIVPGSYVWVSDVGNNTITTTDNSAAFNLSSGQEGSNGNTGSDGRITLGVLSGVTYSVCTSTASGTEYCAPVNVTVNGNTTVVIYLEPVPSAPTLSNIQSPTSTPVLNWTGVYNADSYNIYANNELIGNTTNTTYTDNNPTIGTDTYYVTAVNLAGESVPSNEVTVTVENTKPSITSPSSYVINARAMLNFTVTTTGYPTPAITWSTTSGSLPPGLSFKDNGDGTATLSGQVPTQNQGYYFITFIASNSAGSTSQQFLLTTTDYNEPVTFLNANNVTVVNGVPFSFMIDTTGVPVPPISKLAGSGSLPTDVTLVNNKDGTATLSGDPDNASDYGVFTFTIKATNSSGTVYQPFTLTILKAPVFKAIPNQTTAVGSSFTQTITTTGYPIPSITATGLPNGLSIQNNGDGTATISGTPAVGSGGQYTVTVTATNSQGTTTDSYTLTVNEGPTITSANTATVTLGQSFNFQFTATGYPSPTFSKTGTLPKGVTFTASTGILSGTPATGTAGVYTITITAKNSTGSTSQTFTLIVDQVPIINSIGNQTGYIGLSYTQTITTTGYPIASLFVSGLPNGLTFADNGDGTGTISGTPDTGSLGAYTITVTATSSLGTTATTFTLIIKSPIHTGN